MQRLIMGVGGIISYWQPAAFLPTVVSESQYVGNFMQYLRIGSCQLKISLISLPTMGSHFMLIITRVQHMISSRKTGIS